MKRSRQPLNGKEKKRWTTFPYTMEKQSLESVHITWRTSRHKATGLGSNDAIWSIIHYKDNTRVLPQLNSKGEELNPISVASISEMG
jgi:hypothetical protein